MLMSSLPGADIGKKALYTSWTHSGCYEMLMSSLLGADIGDKALETPGQVGYVQRAAGILSSRHC